MHVKNILCKFPVITLYMILTNSNAGQERSTVLYLLLFFLSVQNLSLLPHTYKGKSLEQAELSSIYCC